MTSSSPLSGPLSDSLWQNSAFIRLWVAQILSKAGSEITRVALPLTAVIILAATPAQMAALRISGSLPNLLFGLFAGVFVDRTRRGPILVGADIGRALLLGTIPLAALLGRLTFIHLVIVVFLSATLTLFFTLGSVSILPSLVKREQLVEANSRLAFSDSVLGIAGPAAAGWLVQLISAPKAIIVDTVSYLLSALSLRGLRAREASPKQAAKDGAIWHEIGEGVRELVRTAELRAFTVSASIGAVGATLQQTVLMLFLVNSLHLTPAEIGIVFAVGSIGSLIGAALSKQVAQRLGIGLAATLGSLLWAVSSFIIPMAGLIETPPLIIIGVGQALSGIGATIFGINQMSIRQHLIPTDRFGRATAARRFLIFGLAAAGAALGGYLGTVFGLRSTLFAGAVGFSLGFLLLFLSPVRQIRNLSA
jgi:MFS family permease